jgi:8-oxo-dGTP diphosphatase
MARVRVAGKAVIIRDGRLLVTSNADNEGIFYLLPGGGQEVGEPLPETLRRECREEVGVDVEVHELLLVRDYISDHHEFAEEAPGVHQLELMFRCSIADDAVPNSGSSPDAWQTGVEWLDVSHLEEYRLYPKILCQLLGSHVPPPNVYIGDVN